MNIATAQLTATTAFRVRDTSRKKSPRRMRSIL
jgi:hypothetical protein